jgi:tRNA (guanine37-N1)-methyltransferase
VSLCIDVITLAPEMWQATTVGVVGRARQKGIWQQHLWHLRDFSDRHDRRVDDRAYGGGPGMVLGAEPLQRSLEHIIAQRPTRPLVVQMDPAGTPFDAQTALRLSKESHITLICGRYEGIDARITEHYVDEQFCMGPYVLSAGDLPGMCMVDAIVRLLPGALGNAQSAPEDSYSQGLLDTPHYTRPEAHALGKVPAVLTSGDHAAITRWRRMMALGRTWQYQPALLQNRPFSDEDIDLLNEYIKTADLDRH